MRTTQFRLAQAGMTILIGPPIFFLCNWIFSGRALLTEYEIGVIFGIVAIRLIDAYEAYKQS